MINLPWKTKDNYPVVSLKKHIDDIFENFWKEPFAWPQTGSLTNSSEFNPKMEVKETDNEIKITAELPGISEKDIEITADNNLLVIKGEKREEEKKEDGGNHYTERRYGSFCRSMTLPSNVITDKIEATFSKGLLHLKIPKEKQQEKRNKIEIKTQ